jgi:hypothetical protein
VAEEAKKKSEGGIISTLLSTAGAFAPVLAATPLAEFAPFAMLAGAAAPVFRSLGLSKPLTVMAQQPTFSGQRRFMTSGNGLAQHLRMGQHPDSMTAVQGIKGMYQPDVLTLSKENPAWLGTFFFDKTFAAKTTIRTMPVVPTLCHEAAQTLTSRWSPGYMAYYSQFYAYWRGSIKFLVRFICSSFTTATVRITHNPYNNVTTDPEAYGGDHVSTIVEIRGDTEYEFTIPYLSREPWTEMVGWTSPTGPSQVNTNIIADCVNISIINPAQTADEVGDSSVFYSIYVAAGEDYDVRDYMGFYLRPSRNELPPPLAIRKQSLRDRFAKPFAPMVPALAAFEQGYVKSESATNIVELLHIETPFNVASSYTNVPILHYADETQVMMLLRPFQFWRGSLRKRFLTAAVKYCGLGSNTYVSTWMTGKAYLDGIIYKFFEETSATDFCVETPWDYRTTCVPFLAEIASDDPEDLNWPAHILQTNNVFTAGFISVGEDFMVGGLLAPPSITTDTYAPTFDGEVSDFVQGVGDDKKKKREKLSISSSSMHL